MAESPLYLRGHDRRARNRKLRRHPQAGHCRGQSLAGCWLLREALKDLNARTRPAELSSACATDHRSKQTAYIVDITVPQALWQYLDTGCKPCVQHTIGVEHRNWMLLVATPGCGTWQVESGGVSALGGQTDSSEESMELLRGGQQHEGRNRRA